MGKKRSRKARTSKGKHGVVSQQISKQMRRDYLASPTRSINQILAHMKGRRTRFVIENPDKSQTNKRYIAVTGDDVLKIRRK